MLVCSPLLQLRLSDCDLTSKSTRAAPLLCLLLLAAGGGDEGMLTLRRGDVCFSVLAAECERTSDGGGGSISTCLCSSCIKVGMIRLGSARLAVGAVSEMCSLHPPSRKRRH